MRTKSIQKQIKSIHVNKVFFFLISYFNLYQHLHKQKQQQQQQITILYNKLQYIVLQSCY